MDSKIESTISKLPCSSISKCVLVENSYLYENETFQGTHFHTNNVLMKTRFDSAAKDNTQMAYSGSTLFTHVQGIFAHFASKQLI